MRTEVDLRETRVFTCPHCGKMGRAEPRVVTQERLDHYEIVRTVAELIPRPGGVENYGVSNTRTIVCSHCDGFAIGIDEYTTIHPSKNQAEVLEMLFGEGEIK